MTPFPVIFGWSNGNGKRLSSFVWIILWKLIEDSLFMMLYQKIVAVIPSSTWRVLSKAGLLERWNKKPSMKGTGFGQPLRPHEHWHVDISILNICGTFFYLCSLLDGCSRVLVHWEIREQMTETEVEIILQKAKEQFQETRLRIISDNCPQFISQGLLRVHPNLGYDPCPVPPFLSAVQRQVGTVP